jgi:ribosomal protein L16 Arg81 hydroxylase
MPETRQQKSNFDPDMAAVMKANIDKYFKSKENSFLETLKSFIETSVEQACAMIVEKMLTPLRNEIRDLKSELAIVRRKCNELEQYSRRANIRIFGIPEDKDEDCLKKTLAFVNEQLDLTFKESDIDRVHRVGRPRMNAARAMIVKFMAYRS